MRYLSLLLVTLTLFGISCDKASEKEPPTGSKCKVRYSSYQFCAVSAEDRNQNHFDPDGDGVVADNCPFTYNPSQKNSSSTDNIHRDAFGNACDPCPEVEYGWHPEEGLLPCRRYYIEKFQFQDTREGAWNDPNHSSKLSRDKDVDRDGVPDTLDPIIPDYYKRCIIKN